MAKNELLKTISLAQHFEAPDDYIGNFGWLCGYSADASFLNDAVERFTRLTISQRASQGRLALAMLLDPGGPHISLLATPGVAHLPIVEYESKPFRLLHAKVALLGFRHKDESNRWKLRLLVSTGNWTRQTLEDSLDLIWRIDINSESISDLDDNTRQNCLDIKNTWILFDWLIKLFDTRLLHTSFNGKPSETTTAMNQVITWITKCSKVAEGDARVFNSKSQSLLSQLPKMVESFSKVTRNYLAMGSGFYESSKNQDQPPEVPLLIINSLRKHNLLSNSALVDLYVNRKQCQSIASNVKQLNELDITIRPAIAQPSVFGENSERSLHAKFLFSANTRENSNSCSSSWVYLGSGNLTHPGFAKKMNAQNGNLEVGVVFPVSKLYWGEGKSTERHLVVTNLLPIQWSDSIDDATSLSAGASIEKPADFFIAPPVAWLTLRKVELCYELCNEESSLDGFKVLDPNGNPCERTGSGFQWLEAIPRQVCISWSSNGNEFESYIPVIDQFGRIAATALVAIDIHEAMWNLVNFPSPPDDDELDNNYLVGMDANNNSSVKLNENLTQLTNYPIRHMMELVEIIATKQTAINEIDWIFWCNRLEQTLGQAGNSAAVKYFRDELKLNPLSPLRHESFLPAFAEKSESEASEIYNTMLDRIESDWKVNELSPIGGIR